MASINKGRVLLGGLAGAAGWAALDFGINGAVLGSRYPAAQQAGHFLAEPRYGSFVVLWLLSLVAISFIVALLYASVRTTCGAGPKTALCIGAMVGFAAAFPMNLSMATWGTFDRIFPLWWGIDLWAGAMVAALIAGAIYREPAA